MRFTLLACATAVVQSTSLYGDEPLAQLEVCAANLKEVEALVTQAKSRAVAAQEALEKSKATAKATNKQEARVSSELDEESATLASEIEKLGALEKAVTGFSEGLEQRRVDLEARMAALGETEALRNAYAGVVSTSEQEVAQMQANLPVGDAGMEQQLALMQGKLQEERQRLAALEAQVASELTTLEVHAASWNADKSQLGTFKKQLQDKIASRAKLEVSVDSLESEAEKLRSEVTATTTDVKEMMAETKTAQKAVQNAVDGLVRDQGMALDLLEEAVAECQSRKADLSAKHETYVKKSTDEHEAYVKKSTNEHEAYVKKTDDAHDALVKKTDDAHDALVAKTDAEKAAKDAKFDKLAEKHAELGDDHADLYDAYKKATSTTDQFKGVRNNVATGVEEIIKDFADSLDEAEKKEAAAGAPPADSPFGKALENLHGQMTSMNAVAPAAAAAPAKKKDGMLRGLVVPGSKA